MKSFQEFITEIFDSSYEFEIFNNHPQSMVYEFFTDANKHGSVMINLADKSTDRWEIIFEINEEIMLTGGGEAIKIFSTVIKIVQDFIQKRSPKIIYFSSNKLTRSRVSLYRKFVQRFSKIYNYKHKEIEKKFAINFFVEIRK